MEIKLKDDSAKSVVQLIRSIVADGTAIETPSEDTIRVSSSLAQELMVKVIESLSKSGVLIESISVNPPTLEEVFLRVTGEGKD